MAEPQHDGAGALATAFSVFPQPAHLYATEASAAGFAVVEGDVLVEASPHAASATPTPMHPATHALLGRIMDFLRFVYGASRRV